MSTDKLLQTLAKAIDVMLNGTQFRTSRKNGFVLLTFEFGKLDGQFVNHISNTDDRQALAKIFRDVADRFENAPTETKGNA